MKFQPRRFVVEVKRGTSREAFASPDHGPSRFSSAEALLFGGSPQKTRAFDEPPTVEPAKPKGRILPSLVEPEPEPISELDPPRKRGRPLGSKNKPKLSPVEPDRAPRRAAEVLTPVMDDLWTGEVAAEPAEDTAELPAPEAPSKPRIRLRDRSRILQRYVHGNMPRAGQRGSIRARRAERSSQT